MGKRLPVGLYINKADTVVRVRTSTASFDIHAPNARAGFVTLASRYLEVAETRVADAPLAEDLRGFLADPQGWRRSDGR